MPSPSASATKLPSASCITSKTSSFMTQSSHWCVRGASVPSGCRDALVTPSLADARAMGGPVKPGHDGLGVTAAALLRRILPRFGFLFDAGGEDIERHGAQILA